MYALSDFQDGNSYINGTGSLTIGASGIDLTYFYFKIYPQIILGTNQTWVLNNSSRSSYIRLYNGLSGSGTLTLETSATEKRGSATFYYEGTPELATFTGGIKLYKDREQNAFLGAEYVVGEILSSTNLGFGTGPISGNNGSFTFRTSASSGGSTPGYILSITNDLVAEKGTFRLGLDQGPNVANIPNMHLTGKIDLGGLLTCENSRYGTTPVVAGDITLRQNMAARMGLSGIHDDYATVKTIYSSTIADGEGNYGSPLILQNHNSTMTMSGAAAGMTYENGTVVELCGSEYNAQSRSGCITVDAASKLGTGDVKILPGGMLNLNAESNIADGKIVEVQGSSLAKGVLALSYDGLPELEGSGVLAIDDTFSSSLDMSTLGDGYMFLGSRDTGTFSGSSFIPGVGNLYRLGGGNSTKTLTISTSVLTGTAGLQVGSPVFRGNGIVYLTKTNTFSGEINVIGRPTHWREPDLAIKGSELIVQANSAGGSPFGNTNANISLCNGRLNVNETYSATPPLVVRKEQLSIEGRGRLYMNCNSYETHMKFGSLVRQNRGVLTIDTRRQKLGDKERILFETAPTVVNGMLPPWILSEKDASSADDQHFLSYDETFGVDHFSNYVTDINAVTATDVFGGSGGALTADRTCYAVRTKAALTGAFTLDIGSGGLILDSSSADIGCNIDFGTAEGIIYNNDIPDITGKISGSGGLTISSYDGHVILRNIENDFTGGIYVNGGTLYADFDTDAAHGSLGPTSNDIYLNGGLLCQHKETGYLGSYLSVDRTITLGTSGGAIMGLSKTESGILPVHSKITGSGMLTIDQQNRDIYSGQVTLSNPANDYTGGTIVPPNVLLPSETSGDITDYKGALKATEEATLGTGDLLIGTYAGAVLEGDTNVNSEANVHLAMFSDLWVTAPAPSFGSLSGSGDVILGSSGTSTELTIGGTDKNSVFYGCIYEKSVANACSITKVGSGLFKLYGEHDYTGDTTVEEGTFSLLGSIAGNLVVDSGANLMAVVKEDGTALLGHVKGDIDFNGNLTLEIPEGYDVPMGTTMTVLTCDGTITGDVESLPEGFALTIVGDEVKVIRVAAGSLFIIQ